MMRKIFLLIISLFFMHTFAGAARAPYMNKVNIQKSSDVLAIEHQHNWSNPLHLSSLRATDKLSGKELFNIATPPLTYLWISPDSRFIVGLSEIRYQNQYQLIVVSGSGQEIIKEDVTSLGWTVLMSGDINTISWYKQPEPHILLNEGLRTLQIEDANGVMRTFRLGFIPPR